MSAPTGVDASPVELAEHSKLRQSEIAAEFAQERAADAFNDLERDLKQATIDLEKADQELEKASEAMETFSRVYWAKRGGEPGR